MTATAQLPPVTLETLDGYPVMRWMDMQVWAGNFQGMQWVHLLIDAYVGSYGHYFVVDGDITMLLDPPLWEKFQISMAGQSSPALVPMESCTINGVIIKPYMCAQTSIQTIAIGEGEVTIPANSTEARKYAFTWQGAEDGKVVDSNGRLIKTLKPGETWVWESKPTHMEVEIGEYERLKAVEKSYNTLCEEMRSEEKLKDAMCLVFKDAYEVGNSHGHDQMKNYQLDDLFDNYWEERRKERERP